MKRFLFALVLSFQMAYSAEEQPVATPNSNLKNSEKQNQTSLEHRKDLKYQIVIALIGYEYGVLHNNFAIGAGYFIDSENLINLRYSFQNSGGLPTNDSAEDYPMTLRAVTLSDRHFFG